MTQRISIRVLYHKVQIRQVETHNYLLFSVLANALHKEFIFRRSQEQSLICYSGLVTSSIYILSELDQITWLILSCRISRLDLPTEPACLQDRISVHQPNRPAQEVYLECVMVRAKRLLARLAQTILPQAKLQLTGTSFLRLYLVDWCIKVKTFCSIKN